MLGYPVLSIRSIPKDEAYLAQVLRRGPARPGASRTPLEINDVWPENYSANSSQKVWAAKFAAHHPNVVVLDLSSFKCGHDAPTYGIIDSIISRRRDALLGPARHRRQQAGRLDQDPGEDLRPQPGPAQGTAGGRGQAKQELAYRIEREAAASCCGPRRRSWPSGGRSTRPSPARSSETIEKVRAYEAGPRRQDRGREGRRAGRCPEDSGHRAAGHQAQRVRRHRQDLTRRRHHGNRRLRTERSFACRCWAKAPPAPSTIWTPS